MKKILLIAIIFLGSFSLVNAQDDANKAERIQALKIAFITKKLDLTANEAQRFWPVYNRYENDIKEAVGENKNGDVIDNEEKVLNIKKRYRPEFIKVVGQPKANNLFNSEREFRGVLMRNLQNRQAQQKPMRLRRQK